MSELVNIHSISIDNKRLSKEFFETLEAKPTREEFNGVKQDISTLNSDIESIKTEMNRLVCYTFNKIDVGLVKYYINNSQSLTLDGLVLDLTAGSITDENSPNGANIILSNEFIDMDEMEESKLNISSTTFTHATSCTYWYNSNYTMNLTSTGTIKTMRVTSIYDKQEFPNIFANNTSIQTLKIYPNFVSIAENAFSGFTGNIVVYNNPDLYTELSTNASKYGTTADKISKK